MNRTILLNGIWATLIILAPSFIAWLVLDGYSKESFDIAEVIGYVTILLAMVFVYLGTRTYRDQHLGGYISFWKALKIGLLIVLIPSIAFGLYNLLYSFILDPEFMDEYYQHMLSKAKATMTDLEFADHKANMESQQEMFKSPLIQFGVMFATVFAIGLIVAFVSAFLLKKDKMAVA